MASEFGNHKNIRLLSIGTGEAKFELVDPINFSVWTALA